MGVRIYSPTRPSECKVAPQFLSPLTSRNRLRADGTPKRSCLKRNPKLDKTARRLKFDLECKFSENDKEDTPPPRKAKGANIMFSPYNKVFLSYVAWANVYSQFFLFPLHHNLPPKENHPRRHICNTKMLSCRPRSY